MTEVELRKMNRAELLELLITVSKENEALRKQVEKQAQLLEERTIVKDKAGSIAEAALQLNGVFDAAQAAAEQYLENIRTHEQYCQGFREAAEREAAEILCAAQQEAKTVEETAQQKARIIEETAQQKAKAMEETAQQKAEAYWSVVSGRLASFYAEHQGLREQLQAEKGKPGK